MLDQLMPRTGSAIRLGITGVPGVGKSTFIEALGLHLINGLGLSVAVLAVDPSSSVRGGSILGDKTRMQRLSQETEAFIRPSPSQGSLGGVHRKTRESLLVCEAAGFDVVLVETVGVGQSETTVANMVDTFLVLMLAGAGDELQGIKKGILEVADILAINKADGENLSAADRARRDYKNALHLFTPRDAAWHPPVLTCSALESSGIEKVWDTVIEHRETLKASGSFSSRRAEQNQSWLWSLVEDELLQTFKADPDVQEELAMLVDPVRTGQINPTGAADRLLKIFFGTRDA
jgi:LAO/AO transport system kinase